MCATGFYLWQDACYSCDGEQSTTIWVLVLIIVVIGIFGFCGWWWRATLINKTKDIQETIESKIQKFAYGAKVQSTVKILIAFTQIILGMEAVFNLNYPSVFADFVDTIFTWLSLSFITDLVGLECIADASFYDALLVETLVPIGILLVLWCAQHASRVRANLRLQNHPDERGEIEEGHRKNHKHCFTAALWLVYLILPSVSSRLFRLFACEPFDDGSTRLTASLDIPCSGATYTGFAVFGGLMILACKSKLPFLESRRTNISSRLVRSSWRTLFFLGSALFEAPTSKPCVLGGKRGSGGANDGSRSHRNEGREPNECPGRVSCGNV